MATLSFYNSFKEYIGDGTIDLDGHTFKVILLNGSHTFTATNTVLADITANQLSTANGYTSGGYSLTATWTLSSGTVTFDADDATWTASGGAITASYAAIYDDTPTSPADPLVASIDFSGEQSAGDGTNFLIRWNASGIFTLS